jgi:hypothetical protein
VDYWDYPPGGWRRNGRPQLAEPISGRWRGIDPGGGQADQGTSPCRTLLLTILSFGFDVKDFGEADLGIQRPFRSNADLAAAWIGEWVTPPLRSSSG